MSSQSSRSPPTDPEAAPKPQPQIFLFVDHNDGRHQPRKRKDWKVIRSHVMQHWHRRERDSNLSRLKSDIVRPGDKPPVNRKAKVLVERRLNLASKKSENLTGEFQVTMTSKSTEGSSTDGKSAPSIAGSSPMEVEEKEEYDDQGRTTTSRKSNAGARRRILKTDAKTLDQQDNSSYPPTQVQRFTGQGVLDPFDTSAVSLSERAQEMIVHYSKIVVPSLYPCKNPATRTNAYFQVILTNPMILTAKLAMASTNARFVSMSPAYASLDAVPTSSFLNYDNFGTEIIANRDWLRYKAKVLSLVNQALKKEDGDKIANSTLHTIITLAAIAHFTGNVDEAVIHMCGVLRIVKLRGGLLEIPPYIIESLCLVDLFLSSGTNRPPMLPYESILALVTRAASTPSGAEFEAAKPPFHPSFTNLLAPELFPPTLLRITCDLYQILFLISAFDDVPSVGAEFFGHLPLQLCFAGHRLTAAVPGFLENQKTQIKLEPSESPAISPPSSSSPITHGKSPPGVAQPQSDFLEGLPTRPLQESTRIALLIFIHTSLIKSNPHLYMLHNMVLLLEDSLTAAGVPSGIEIMPPKNRIVLLWILFVGAQGSRGRVERPWFITLIARLASVMRAEQLRGYRPLEWKDVRLLMERFLWLDSAMHDPWRRIWKEVEQVASVMALAG